MLDSIRAASRGWAEDFITFLAQHIGEAGGEWVFGTDDYEADLFLTAKPGELFFVGVVHRHVRGFARGAGIARRAEDTADARGLRQLPDQCVLAPAFADHEYIRHESILPPRERLVRDRISVFVFGCSGLLVLMRDCNRCRTTSMEIDNLYPYEIGYSESIVGSFSTILERPLWIGR